MTNWTLIKGFLSLAPQKQVSAVLLLIILSAAGVAKYYDGLIRENNAIKDLEIAKKEAIIKEKDNQYKMLAEQQIQFMQREISIRLKFKNEIDSLKTNQK